MTCGVTGVGVATMARFRVPHGDNWYVSWIEIDSGLETVRFTCEFYVIYLAGYIWRTAQHKEIMQVRQRLEQSLSARRQTQTENTFTPKFIKRE